MIFHHVPVKAALAMNGVTHDGVAKSVKMPPDLVKSVALINKTIRTAYAILKNKTEYNATLLSGNIA